MATSDVWRPAMRDQPWCRGGVCWVTGDTAECDPRPGHHRSRVWPQRDCNGSEQHLLLGCRLRASDTVCARPVDIHHSNMYNIVDLLTKKRNGQELTWEEIEFFTNNVKSGGIREAQIGQLYMCHKTILCKVHSCARSAAETSIGWTHIFF